MYPTVVKNAFSGILMLHQHKEQPKDPQAQLSIYAQAHDVLYALGIDISDRVLVKGKDGEQLIAPAITLQHIVRLVQISGASFTNFGALSVLAQPHQQEFIAKAKEVSGKPLERSIAKIEKANAITQWIVAVELGKIGLEKAQAFRDAYAQLSPEDQKAFVSTIDTKTLLSSGTTPAHVAFNGLKEDQRTYFSSELVTPSKGRKVQDEKTLIQYLVHAYSTLDTNYEAIEAREKMKA